MCYKLRMMASFSVARQRSWILVGGLFATSLVGCTRFGDRERDVEDENTEDSTTLMVVTAPAIVVPSSTDGDGTAGASAQDDAASGASAGAAATSDAAGAAVDVGNDTTVTEPQVEVQPDADVAGEVQPDVVTEPEAEGVVDPLVEPTAAMQPDVAVEPEADVAVEPEAEVAVEPEADMPVEPEMQPEVEVQPEVPAENCEAVDPCTGVPAVVGSGVVDGLADEYCAAWEFSVATGVLVNPADSSRTDKAEIRTAWASDGLHVHIKVFDTNLKHNDTIYEGDNVQFFISNAAPTAGPLGDSEGNATQIYVLPPAENTSGENPGQTQQYAEPAIENYTVLVEDDGYNIEFIWGLDGAAAGSQIGFDVMVGINDTGEGRAVEFALAAKSPGETSCEGEATLYCDALTWCTPTLQ